MKHLQLIVIFAFGSISAFGQTDDDFAALETFLNSEKIEYLAENNFARYQQLAVLNRSYYTNDFGNKDVSNYENALNVQKIYPVAPDLSEAMIMDGTLNLLAYRFELSKTKYTYYRIANSDKILVIPPTNLSLQKAGLETL